jgi:CheY-like chemotaxis protein
LKVQIVDDNKKFRETLRKFILPVTESIFECENGQEAINTYKEYFPDFVLMDIRMPVLDGVTATRKILEMYPEARIILISDNDKYFKKNLRESGALAFFPKENLSEVIDFINNMLKKV